MKAHDFIQWLAYIFCLAAVTKPMGLHLERVLNRDARTALDPVLKPLESFTYRLMGVRPTENHDWRQYTFAMLMFSLVTCLFTYLILRCQQWLPLNPQGFGPVAPDLAFNIAISFTTNTNWQSYSGETTLSYFSQMVALTLHNFTSAAVGIGIAAALVRSIAAHSSRSLGNFWVDLVRITYYLLLPLSLVFALFLVSQGTIQNFSPYTPIHTIEPSSGPEPILVQGPMASQVAIKMLGTNGGGYTNANAAHPFENPTPLSNFLQMLSIFAISSGLTYYLGRATRNPAHGWTLWSAMLLLFLAGSLVAWWAESHGNPIHHQLGLAAADGNMEGKEVRFGIFNSSLFATITTDASCGAVNSMHDSFTALGGLVTLFNIQAGEIIFGGVGSGLYGMLVFVIITVFIAGLMVGRTPEYLGKKIQAYEIKMAMLALLILSAATLVLTAWAAVSPWGTTALNSAGPHGLSELLYAFSSATGNNGSAFAGLSANTPWLNLTLGFAMFAGRFLMIIPIMALAGSFALKKPAPPSPGTLPVSGPTFTLMLVATIVLVGALNFLPSLALGPIVEHFLTLQGNLF